MVVADGVVWEVAPGSDEALAAGGSLAVAFATGAGEGLAAAVRVAPAAGASII